MIEVLDDAAAVATAAAERVVALLAEPQERLAVCLSGGSTPERLYRLLASEYRARVPWPRVHWFFGDERFVPADSKDSNMRMAKQALFDRAPVPAANIHAIATGAASPDEAAVLYEKELQRFYGAERLDPRRPLFAVVLLGLGEDGHTASVFPGDPLLAETHRWVAGVERQGLAPLVPRVTLMLPALASTRELLFLVSGARKREALQRVLAGEHLPAAHARTEGAIVWLVDREALA